MIFQDHLSDCARHIETVLGAILDETAPGAPARLVAAMRHALLGGGKRLRPFLVMESARLFGAGPDQAARAGAALECIHCYSLVHDDLPAMDDDAMRRGRPTVHIAFDEATAILAGDALLTIAFEILADARTHPDAGVRASLVMSLAHASGARGMAGGQMLDLEAEKNPPDEAGVRRLQAMKTGALLRHACEAGAILGQAGARERAALVSYGEALGAAFQIADDILDVEATPEQMGKATAKDAAAGKATLVAHLGIEVARARLVQMTGDARAALAGFGPQADMLRAAADFVMTRKN